MYQEEWQKREHSQDINNPERTGSDPLQKLQPRFGCYPCSQLRLRIKPLRDVGTRLVHHDRNIVSLSD
jgi:hypothetical protein